MSLAAYETTSALAKASRVKLGNDLQRVRAAMERAIAESEGHNRSSRRLQQPPPPPLQTYDAAAEGVFEDAVEHERAQQLRLVSIVSDVEYNEQRISSRRDDLLEINKKAVIVNGMMKDLAVLVDAQGEGVSAVAKNVAQTKAHAEGGLKEVQKAQQIQDDGQCAVI